jgi:hemin uptake protein HemP
MAMPPSHESASPSSSNQRASVKPSQPQAEFDSHELMRGGREVLIRHAGKVYRLQHTRNDKLILVK